MKVCEYRSGEMIGVNDLDPASKKYRQDPLKC